jgi:hypothetical protein
MTVALERGIKHTADWDIEDQPFAKIAKYEHKPDLSRPRFIAQQSVQVALPAIEKKRKAEESIEKPRDLIKKPRIDFPHGVKRKREDNFLKSYEPESKRDRVDVLEKGPVEQDIEQLIVVFKKLLTKECCIVDSHEFILPHSEIY